MARRRRGRVRGWCLSAACPCGGLFLPLWPRAARPAGCAAFAQGPAPAPAVVPPWARAVEVVVFWLLRCPFFPLVVPPAERDASAYPPLSIAVVSLTPPCAVLSGPTLDQLWTFSGPTPIRKILSVQKKFVLLRRQSIKIKIHMDKNKDINWKVIIEVAIAILTAILGALGTTKVKKRPANEKSDEQ